MADFLYDPKEDDVNLYLENGSYIDLILGKSSLITLSIETDPVVRDPGTLLVPFEYIANTPSSTWTIPHNLGYRPDVSVYSIGGVEVVADILHIDFNNVLIMFNLPYAGRARLF